MTSMEKVYLDILDEVLAVLGIGPFQTEDFTPGAGSEYIQEQEHQNP